MTRQEVFETAVLGLLNQGKRSMNADGCAYRGDNNCKCAVGFLIEDDEYNEYMEDKTVSGLLCTELLSLRLKDLFTANLGMLQELQDTHDNYNLEDWPTAFRGVSSLYELEWTDELESAAEQFNQNL